MISLIVAVCNVYPGKWNASVFTAKDETGGRHRCVANAGKMFRVPLEGEVWRVNGTPGRHPEYGDQILVDSAMLVKPSGRLVVDFLIRHPGLRGIGIGRTRAARLYDTFGSDLYRVLETGAVERLNEVIPEDCARQLVDAWAEVSQEAKIIEWLSTYGFDIRLAHKLRTLYGNETIRQLQENPYRMLAFESWGKVDRMAQALGVKLEDPIRQVAAVEACLYHRLSEKHTLTPRSTLQGALKRFFPASTSHMAEKAVRRALEAHAIVEHGDSYQPLGAALMEAEIAGRLRARLARRNGHQLTLFDGRYLESNGKQAISDFEKAEGFCLNAEQRQAVLMTLTEPLSVLSGGAGVGKTTALKAIGFIITRFGDTVYQMALSGRAASRLREATGQEATTIAAFLNRAKHERFDPQSSPYVIVDESSMLDLPLMYRLIRALPKKARLLLVGDPYQLPPIGFGLIYQRLCMSPAVPRTELIQVFRQNETTGIPQVAAEIRRGVVPDLADYTGVRSGVSFIESSKRDILQRIIDIKSDLAASGECQILGVLKAGPSGIAAINQALHQAFSVGKDVIPEWELAESEPVIYLENDYARELWNGSLGIIQKVSRNGDGRWLLECVFESGPQTLEESSFPKVGLAHAITVHKAQGSQFERVIIPITKNRLMDRTLVYTALTRGIHQVVFVRDKQVLNQAIVSAPKAHEREVGFWL